MVINNISGFLFILFMFMLTHKTDSFENDEREIHDAILIQPYVIKPTPTAMDQYPFIHESINAELPSVSVNRRVDSAEKYFHWIKKTQRPVEYFRGKRFWLFAKKDDSAANADFIPNVNTQQNSLTQGLWRSGIVGRRRRRR